MSSAQGVNVERTLMLIDDNEDLTDLLAFQFRRSGYKVLVAGTGADALEIFRLHCSLDFILLDVQLPDISGPDLLDKIESEYPSIIKDTPIMFYTAGEAPSDDRTSGCLSKMSDARHILAEVKSCVPLERTVSAYF
jgi:CheY-like chemotaxis protein